MGQSKVEIFQRADDDWGWRLVAGNGEVVASSEGYTRKADAEHGAADALNAATEAKDAA